MPVSQVTEISSQSPEKKSSQISGQISSQRVTTRSNKAATVGITAPKSTAADNTAAASKVCWIELKQYPYQPDHQVELLHLQAEADALLMKLQNDGKQHS